MPFERLQGRQICLHHCLYQSIDDLNTSEEMEATYIKASPSSGHGFVISIAEYNSVRSISVAGPMLSLGLPNKRGIFVDISQAMVLEPHGLIDTGLHRSTSHHESCLPHY